VLTLKLKKDWSALQDYEWEVHIPYFVISFLVLIVMYLIIIKVWKMILLRLDAQLPYKRAIMIWFRTSVMKYLPGKVWNILGMVYMCEREGITKTKTLLSGFVNQIFSLASATLFSMVYLYFSPEDYGISLRYLLYLLPILSVFCIPPVLRKVLTLFSTRKGITQYPVRIDVISALIFYFCYSAAWIVYGAAFLIFTRAFVKFPLSKSHVIISMFIISHILGFLSLVTPGGIGVREGILTYLLKFHFPLSVAIVISISSRFLIVAADALCFGTSYLMKR
jgi:hypothetical protein